MAIELRVPAVGESITEVRIEKWLKAEGDRVERDETVCVLESEKSSIDLPAPAAGRIIKILKQVGETAKIDDILAYMEELPADEPGSAAPAVVPAAPQKTPESGPARAANSEPAVPEPARLPVAHAVQSGERQEEAVPMTPIRKHIAARLVEVHQTMAPVTTFNEIDMSVLAQVRQEHQAAFQEKHKVKLGMMSCFVKACVEALKQFPQINAQIRDEQIVYHNYCDIAIAISGGKGLVAPVLRNAELMSFADIEKAILDFAARAKVNKLEPDELRGGTFTITNGGIFGSLMSTPIINPPQSGILGMHAIQERPVAVSGQVVIRPMMYVALTYDHRLVDGREAVTFLRAIKQYVEDPVRILLEL